jgi:hypothetical protein
MVQITDKERNTDEKDCADLRGFATELLCGASGEMQWN